jgi:hypothetical protein
MRNKKFKKYLRVFIPLFGAIVVVTVTVLLLTNAFALTDKKPTEQEFQSALSNIPNYKPTAEVKARVETYFRESTTPTMMRGLNLLLEKDLDAKLAVAKKQIASLRMDGKIDDWVAAGLTMSDDLYDNFEINKDIPLVTHLGVDDIVSYGFVADANYLYGYIEPREMPKAREKYNYRLNLNSLKTRWMQYALVSSSAGNYIEEYNVDTQKFVRNVSKTGATFIKKNIFEFKIPVKNLKKLPKTFQVSAIAWHSWKNSKDEATGPTEFTQSINEQYRKAALEVLCRYAETTELIPDDPLFLAQALTDAFWYKLADKDTKEKLIVDSLALIDRLHYAEKKYSFAGQKKFEDLDWSALLALTNRAVMHGSYVDWNFYLDNTGSMSREAYDFMLVRPETIDTAERILADNQFVDVKNLPETIKKIETFLNSKEKYRRFNFADIEILKNTYSGDKYWEDVYNESLADIENNDLNITVVNGFDINKGNNFSASFQTQYLADNGYFFGNCGDVTAIAISFYRALGVPAIPLSYYSLADNFIYGVHTFPVYYSGLENKWFNYTRDGNPIWPFAKVDSITDYNVLYNFEGPQIGSAWRYFKRDFLNNPVSVNSRKSLAVVSEAEWKELNISGYPMSDLEELIFE